MKLFAFVFSLAISLHSFAQTTVSWNAPVSIAGSGSGNNHPRISLNRNGDPLILWGKTNGNAAYFSRWNGSAFSTAVMLNPMAIPVFTDSWAGPDMSSHGDTVYVVFKHTPEDTNHIYMVKSVNGGQSFGSAVRVDNVGDSASRFPTLATDGTGNPLVGFMKFKSDFSEARYVVSRSSDLGNTFTSDVRASGSTGSDVCDCCPGALLSSGNNSVMLYRNNLSNIRTVWAGFSTDNGNTFNSGTELDKSNWMAMACPASGPDGIIYGDSLYTVYMSGTGGARIHFSRASIVTQQPGSSGRFTSEFANLIAQNYPRIANAGEQAAVVWKENAQGKARICMKFTNSISQGFPVAYDTLFTGSPANADVAMAPGVIYVVWEDDASGTVMYMKGTYAVPASARHEKANKTFTDVYPNPANEHFTVMQREVSKCVLTDISGKKYELSGNAYNEGTTFSLNGMMEGFYLLQINDKAGNIYNSRLMIQKQ